MAEEDKAIVQRYFEEIFNQGNLEVADEICSPDYVDHDPTNLMEIRGPEGLKEYVKIYRDAFPDLEINIEDIMAAEDNKVVARWTAQGTHEGELMGVAPTGQQAEVAGTSIFQISEGKIEEEWDNWDYLGLMSQLGILPGPPEAFNVRGGFSGLPGLSGPVKGTTYCCPHGDFTFSQQSVGERVPLCPNHNVSLNPC